MIDTKKYFFLPFLDNLTAVGISFLLMLFFGNWFKNPTIGAIATFFMLLTLCGRIYVRMWNLSKRNTLRHYGLTIKNFINFMLPLVIFDLVLAVFFILCEHNIIPLNDVVVKSFYNFPDDAKRELINVSLFNYVGPIIRVWFAYFVLIFKNSFILFLAPVLSLLSALAGYYLGNKNKQIADTVVNITEKAKDKFNE